MKSFRELRESHYPTQGSSVEYPPYKEMDMNNLVKDAINDIPEDDGPHTSDVPDVPNFTHFANPEDVINQPSSEGNREFPTAIATRKSGKPFKALRKKMSYGVEDLSGAVAQVAIGEAVKDESDKGEYDYEGDMAKSSLRTIVRNAQMMHDMLDDETNLPEWVASKITLAEDYIVTAAQYMHSEMNEEFEPLTEEEYDAYRDHHLEAGTWDREKAHVRSGGKPNYGKYLTRSGHYPNKRKSSEVKEPHAVHINGKKWKSFSSHGHATNVAKKIEAKGGGKKVTVHKEEVEQTDEANLTPYRNTELGARSTKRAGQPRASISKQFWRPPEGFTKKGIEKTPTSKMKKEEVELDEVITKKTPTSDVIHDFVHSKNPKFVGKSKKERIRMALGAKYAMMRGKK